MYHKLAAERGMTLKQFLAIVDSDELSELVVLQNLPYWEERIANAADQSGRIKALIMRAALSSRRRK